MIKNDFKAFMKPKNETKIVTNRQIWGYTRVSGKIQKENYSLEEQMRDIEEYAKKNNYYLEKTIGGTYESASGDFSRKEFTRLIDEIKKNKRRPYAIAIKFINRFSRTGANAITIVDELVEKMGVHLIETDTGLCTAKIDERMEIYHKLIESQEENLQRLRRTIPGMIAFLKAGNWLGNPPYGYTCRGTRVRNFKLRDEFQVITINENGEKLRLAWKWKLQGEQDHIIQKKLSNLGLTLKNQFISAMWRRPFYCGVNTNSLLDAPVKGNWEPLISEAEFLKVQELLNPSKAWKYNVYRNDIDRPLTRFLKCSHCGRWLSGYEVKKKRAHYYKCTKCKGVSLNAKTTKGSRNTGINDIFIELLSGITLKDDYLDLFKLQLLKMFNYLNKDTITALAEQKKIKNELMSNMDTLEKKFLFSSSVSEDLYKKHKSDLEFKISQSESKIADLEFRTSNHNEFILKAINVCENISRYWELGDADNKQRIQKVLFNDGLVIVPEKREVLTNNLNLIFSLVKGISSDCKDDKKIKVDNFADFYVPVAGSRIELPTSGL